MATTSESVPFSELIQHPRETTSRLDRAETLRLVRRNQPDLMLVAAERAERDAEIFDVTTRLLVGIIAREPAPEVLRSSVLGVFAWTRFLPDAAVDEFLAELVGVARASAEIRNLRPVAQVIVEWQHTAEIHADPELYRMLTREFSPEDDFGPVDVPAQPGQEAG
ncbi:hypothetical protein Caci_8447 [Catenulispora acidiphila DSM 44928]|uniref:Prevent-host-death family protein n=1 Tax=Catenulispora acidiphila (strain DSM 44928 / JCM 14897 / NBRC 102108 / NRRL B-24433 / ID139908) TaxID=479433 RepID=C7PX13_CATAD|nr:DUF6247 family protein [Catenulispora acidiphila]ACU77270.1 hypothetical protein Caci_8447 [Catenulispora acidiphila DSM 44928]